MQTIQFPVIDEFDSAWAHTNSDTTIINHQSLWFLVCADGVLS